MSETPRELRHLTVLVEPDVYAALEAIAARWTADGHENTPESVAFVALGPAVLALAEQHDVGVRPDA